MSKIKVSIGNDHAGTELKNRIVKEYSAQFDFTNHGTDGSESVDYPDYVHPVAYDVEQGVSAFGILICGSANGVCMTANKHQKVRAALCWTTEIAKLARQHNNANAISIPARYVSKRLATNMVKTFLETEFEGGRHKRRVDKMSC